MDSSNRLWTYNNSFDKRFSPEFFKQIPQSPGVYWMLDSKRSSLFVGRTNNLQQGLASYCLLKTHSAPKKLCQLLEEVRSLEWSSTETYSASFYLQQEILKRFPPRLSPPKPSPFSFLKIGIGESCLVFEVGSDSSIGNKKLCYGPFPSLLSCQRALGAFCRLYWWSQNPGDFQRIPQPLLKPLVPLRQSLALPNDEETSQQLRILIDEYWAGESSSILEYFEAFLNPAHEDSKEGLFLQCLHSDLDQLNRYFSKGPSRIKKLKDLFPLPEKNIEPDWLDNLADLIF